MHSFRDNFNLDVDLKPTLQLHRAVNQTIIDPGHKNRVKILSILVNFLQKEDNKSVAKMSHFSISIGLN